MSGSTIFSLGCFASALCGAESGGLPAQFTFGAAYARAYARVRTRVRACLVQLTFIAEPPHR